VKSVATFILLMVSFFAVASAKSTSPPIDLFDQQNQTVQTNTYAPTDSLQRITNDVNREAQLYAQPSPFVIYNDTNTPQSTAPASSAAPILSNVTGWASFFANHDPLPGDRAGLQKYLSIVSPDTYASDQAVQSSNTGISAWFSREVGSNACLERRAIDFYTAVGKSIGAIQSPPSALSRDIRIESRGKLSPGWLWKLAMRSSGGDSGLALTLIGMCGHDDHAQSGPNSSAYTFRDDSENARAVINYKLERYAKISTDLQFQIKKPSVQSNALLSGIRTTTARLKTAHTYATIACPTKPSVFFSSESLGAGVDIPQSLKDEIQQTQNPDRLFDLPAKYYHVYGGAFLTCQMIEAGMKPLMAKAAAAQGAKMYRGIYLCQILSDSVIGWSPDGYDSPEDFLMSPELSKKCASKSFATSNSGVCALSGQALYYRSNIRDQNELRRKITAMVATADASVLYRKWFLGGITNSLGGHVACTETRLRGPSDLSHPEADFGNSVLNFMFTHRPLGWSSARYENAKRKLQTWVEDSKWTIAQHTAGAEFAAKVCKPRPANESMEQAACRIDAAKSSPAAPQKAVH